MKRVTLILAILLIPCLGHTAEPPRSWHVQKFGTGVLIQESPALLRSRSAVVERFGPGTITRWQSGAVTVTRPLGKVIEVRHHPPAKKSRR